jgi:hypothetical protein
MIIKIGVRAVFNFLLDLSFFFNSDAPYMNKVIVKTNVAITRLLILLPSNLIGYINGEILKMILIKGYNEIIQIGVIVSNNPKNIAFLSNLEK